MIKKNCILFVVLLLIASVGFAQDEPILSPSFYNPYDNIPPGSPPNYNLIDSSYFQGVPNLPDPLTNDAGGFYIFSDTSEGKWYITNFLYSRGKSLEQFHGSILVNLSQPPAPNVNIWSKGFELSNDLKQNDRWGWVRWPDSIAPNLYEIWWDITIDYAKKKDTGDFRDTLGVEVAGCAIDFNIWSSGHDVPFDETQVYLGDDMIPLSDVPGFSDTYSGITDQYQFNNPENDPNTSVFTTKILPGATYNKNGLISPGTSYGDMYSGSYAYDANGIQFATMFCPPANPPNFVRCEDEDEGDDHDDDDEEDDDDDDDEDDEDEDNCDRSYVICAGESIIDTITVTDPDDDDSLSVFLFSGPGSIICDNSTSPAYCYFEFYPDTSGEYTIVFSVNDDDDDHDDDDDDDTMEVTFYVTISSAPTIELPFDTTYFQCMSEQICLPVTINDVDCDITSVSTNIGSFTGSIYGYDQLASINNLGGTVTQVGGGSPGTVLLTSADFVLPLNSLSGVSVLLPDFIFADSIADYGTFSTDSTFGNSPFYMLSSPTDMTYTLPGSGGPDGGDGDGSITFVSGDYCVIGFKQYIASCYASNSDFVVFTNTDGGGNADFNFLLDDSVVFSVNKSFIAGMAGSGDGGTYIDLPDGIIYNMVHIVCQSSSLEIDAIAARVTQSTAGSELCFTPDTAGVYEIIVSVTDTCGSVGSDTMLVTITKGNPPVANAGNDFTQNLCTLSEICFGVNFSDADNDLALTELVSGVGTLTGNQVCFTPASAGDYTFIIHAVDTCGADDYDTVVVSVNVNNAPIATQPDSVTLFLCDTTQLCTQLVATDADSDSLTWSLISGVGSVTTSGNYCFTPSGTGIIEAVIAVTYPCGSADTITTYYDITINSAPIAVDPASPFDKFLCQSEQVCYQFSASDVDSGTLTWTMLAGSDGTITTDGLWCFTPIANGSFTLSAVVTDSCGLADTTSKTFNIIINDTPLMALGADTSVSLCLNEQICLDYAVSDIQGANGLTEAMLSGFGTLDTLLNQICFVPSSAGSYQFIMSVTDSCGTTGLDTINVSVALGELATISCPIDTIVVNLCAADSICQLIGISPLSAVVSTSLGTYANGELCFFADTSGIYTASIIADESCGSDTCEIVFEVIIGSAAQISCPAPQNIFICESDSICIPVGVNGSDVSVSVSPIGSYQSGNICFPADTSGHYELEVIAVTACGSDTCIVIVDVVLNSAPIAVDPPAIIDTFLCDNQSLCYQLVANDADGSALTWSKLSGIGTVSSSGQFCFTSSGAGSYVVSAVVADSCGAVDTVSMTYNVTLNSAPLITIANDTTVTLCVSQSVCVPYLSSDIDNNISGIDLLVGNGVVDTMNSQICFYPNTTGTYQFIARVTDECGLEAIDTVNITVTLNVAPIVDAGADQILFQCLPTEICQTITATDTDGNMTLLEMTEGVGTFNAGELCFTPDSNFCYEFIFRAVDDCGLEAFDTLIICVDLNNAPTVDAGIDQTIFQCTPAEICVPASSSDSDGNLTSTNLTSMIGIYNGTSICFTPDSSGIYTFILEATDDCGLTSTDTLLVTVTLNTDPICNVPADTILSQCTLAPVCLPLSGSDIDNNLDFCTIVSGPGSISGGNWCYTPTASQVVTVTVECVDSCGAVCQSTFSVEFKINQDPTISFATTTDQFLCNSVELCLDYSVSDPNDPQAKTVTLLTAVGTLDEVNNQVCFTPDTSGMYTFILNVTDDCGASSVDTAMVMVTINSAPIVNLESNQTINLCQAQEICLNASISDIDNNLSGFTFTGNGLYNGSTICFTPTTSGDYQFILEATDACGVSTIDTVVITVELNSTPTVQFAPAPDTLLCSPTSLCVSYTATDADGLLGMTELMVSGFGTIDTTTNQICYTPTTAGSYEFIIQVIDSCGASALDTVVMLVDFGESAIIACPTDTIDINLCAADVVCQMIDIQPATAIVTASFGTYTGGELCFTADTSGIYTITLIADESCGSDSCNVVFNVTIGTGATISCPSTQSLFICEADSICIPVGINGADVSVTVSPFGSYQAGNICFPADTSGHYEISVVATTACGSDSCVIVVDVVINDAPIADDPAGQAAFASTAIDTFLCAADQICYQFTATDVNGGTLIWSRLSGDGTVSPTGLWCFNASNNMYTINATTSYSVVGVVTDSCGASDTLSLTYNVDINSAPLITIGNIPLNAGAAVASVNNNTVQLCSGTTLCFDYSTSDVDNNISSVSLLTPLGILNTVDSTVCFTPDTSGTYLLVMQVTDSCGATGIDSLNVIVEFNDAPIVNAGVDDSIFLCDNSQLCWGVSVTDIDANIDSIYITTAVGTYNSSTICFTPDTIGVYTFILRAVDVCGLYDEDTVQYTVGLNSPPICNIPNDTTLFQCSPTEIRLPLSASDVDDNFDHCEILAGPGSIIGNEWVYTPTSDQSVMVKIMCLDSCGAACIDSFSVTLELNDAPVVDAGDDFTQFLCAVEEICLPITYSDQNNNLDFVQLITTNGTLNTSTNEICFTPTASDGQSYRFIVKAVDVCGAESFDTVNVVVDYNNPPSLDVPPSFVVYLDDPGEVCFDVSSYDVDTNMTSVTVTAPGTYDQLADQVCFVADSSGEYCFTITASDDCGQLVTRDICITIQIDECFLLQIDKTHATFQGQYETVKIYYDGSTKEIGGFDVTIGYDQSALSVGDVRPGDLFTDCGWEYFTYRMGPNGNCGTGCPTGVLRIVGIAETNNGGYHPDCFMASVVGDIAQVDFLVSNDRTLECQYAAINFFWFDCGDNTLSSRLGDTLWMSRDVFGLEGNIITDNSYGFPGYYGAHDDCMVGGGEPGKMPIRCVDFTNGGIDIVCADSIDAVGDINLNEISYEIADAVLYSNYFVYGLSVFTQNVEGQIAASDVNKDGLSLSVADLVYLVRVIVGDALPYAKRVANYNAEAEFIVQNGQLVISKADDKIGAVSLTIEGDARPELIGDATKMNINYDYDGEFTKVIIYSLDGKASLAEGELLKLNGHNKISEIDVGSYDGYIMTAKLESLPDYFELSQNYPNPFNPTTNISFGLPIASDWELVVYNLLGQVVDRFEDNSEAGFIEIEWDASKYASGVYFYRLRAGEFSDTRKMVLLK